MYFMDFYLLMHDRVHFFGKLQPADMSSDTVCSCKKASHCGDGLFLDHFRVL